MADLADLYPGYASHWIDTSAGRIFARMSPAMSGAPKPPLVLLHGHPQSNVMWHRIAPLLSEHFTLVLPDLPGYGWSAAPIADDTHAPYTKRAMAKAVVELMSRLGFARFDFVGHDRGARVGYRLALDHPGRIGKLALLDIVTTWDMWHRLTPPLATRAWHWTFLAQPAPFPETLIGHDPKFFFDARAGAGAGGKTAGVFDPRALAHYHAAYEDPVHIHAMCEDYRAGRTTDLADDEADRAASRKIGCAVQVLWGTRGLPAVGGLDVLGCWRDWTTDLCGGAIESGHYIPEENPAATAAALLQFLNG
jgi:haloacetate dehalogenase